MIKTRKYIAVIFAAMVMGISGCNDDLFLEEHPDTFYTAEDAFKTVDQVKACVTNMYAHARYWLQNDVFLKGAGTDMFDTPMWRSSGNGMSNFCLLYTSVNTCQFLGNITHMYVLCESYGVSSTSHEVDVYKRHVFVHPTHVCRAARSRHERFSFFHAFQELGSLVTRGIFCS